MKSEQHKRQKTTKIEPKQHVPMTRLELVMSLNLHYTFAC